MSFKRTHTLALTLFALFALSATDYARGPTSSSSSSRSSSSSSSSSSSRSSSYSGGGSSYKSPSYSGSTYKSPTSSNSSSGWGTSKKVSPSTGSKADQSTSAFTNQSTGRSSRSDWFASQTKEDKSLQSYVKPAKVTTPPSTTILGNGTRVPITYDEGHKGYGYTNELGQWILWSSLVQPRTTIVYTDHGNYGGSTQTGFTRPAGNDTSTGHWFLIIFGIILLSIIIVVAFTWCCNKAEAKRHKQFPPYTPTPDKPKYSGKVESTVPVIKTKWQKWQEVRKGSIITLKDAQALKDCQDKGIPISRGMAYEVLSTLMVKTNDGLSGWKLFFMNAYDQDIVLLVKNSGDHTDHRVYFNAPDFIPGSREDMCDNNQNYLFQEPAQGAAPSSWNYTTQIFRTEGDGTVNKELTYSIKAQGEQTGKSVSDPLGIPGCVTTLVEYISTDPTENPELMIVETGKESHTHIQMFLGANIRASEIETLRAE